MRDDAKAIAEVRRAVGDDIAQMSDFNQGQSLTSALCLLHAPDNEASARLSPHHRAAGHGTSASRIIH